MAIQFWWEIPGFCIKGLITVCGPENYFLYHILLVATLHYTKYMEYIIIIPRRKLRAALTTVLE